MKIIQFHLIAFGLFTDKTLDFSSQAPGLHILYGANEAGKSTMRRAVTHLFFGIPERTPDGFLHPNDQLRIGARLLNSSGEELTFYRRKGRKNTLLDVHNRPIEEEQLQPFLGGMNEAQFTALCCFDHERLQQGGEELLQGGGDLGESLFEAGTGSLKVHDVLAELDKEKEELFKARGTKPLLNRTIRAYKEACQQVQDRSLSPNQWSEFAKKLEDAQQQNLQLTHQLQANRAEQHRLERIQRTFPLLQRHQELQTELVTLEQVILLPDDAASRHFEVKVALRTAQAQEQQGLQDITQLQNQINAINIPQALLAHKATLDDLRGRLGSHQKAARDLPGVRTEMRTVESEARLLLQRLYPQFELPDVFTKLAVTNPQREHLKRQADIAPVLHEKQHQLTKRLEELTEYLAQQHQALEALPSIPDLTLLRSALARACKHGNLEEIQTQEQQQARLLTEKANLGLKQMGWTGSLDSLETAPLPRMERIDSFERRFNELENDRQRIKERLLDTRQRHERSTQKINALSWAGDIPTENTLISARTERQKHWQKIKLIKSPKNKENKENTASEASLPLFDNSLRETQTLSFDGNDTTHSTSKEGRKGINQLIQAFEETQLSADELADRLRREANRVAEYSMLLAEQQSAQCEQEQQTKKWHTVEALITKVQQEWEDTWKSLSLKPWTPAEMRSWLNDGLSLRQQATQLRERRRQIEERQQLLAALCQEITQALTPLTAFVKGPILTRLSDLIKQGDAGVNEVTNLQHQQEKLQLEINTLIREQQRTEAALQKANQALKQWQTDWAKALTPLQLPAETLPETARNVLNDLDHVLNKIDKANGLRRRVELMQKDAKLFRHDVANLANKIAPELVNEAAEQVVPELSNRLSQTEKEVTRSEQLQQRLSAEQRRLTYANQQVKASQALLQALLEQARCNDSAALEAAEQASSHKKELQHELAELEQQLVEQGEGQSLADLANAATAIDIDQLSSQLQNSQEHIQQLEQERSTIDQHIGELRILLKQMDGNANAAQAADEAQMALTEVQELSERYMQVHLAASVLRKSMELYREQHQGPVIKRAGDLFQRFTLGKFGGLKTDYTTNNDRPILVGLRAPDSAGILTSGMSEGTRDQLYLALRLASIEHHMAKKSNIPLILDDILIHFDDERSKAALEVLGELSEQTQILFLTHHPRLVELAQAAVPNNRLVMHQL